MSRARVIRRSATALVLLAAGLIAWGLRPWSSGPPIRVSSSAFVASGPSGRAILWAVGDGADGGAAAKAVAARIGAGPVDRFLYLGDVYGSGIGAPLRGDGSARDMRENYATVYGRLAGRTAPTPGNHEWPRRGDGYEPYWRGVSGSTPPAFYAFTAGGWQILSLNSEAPRGRASAQLRWLRSRLAGARGTCRLAFWHRPRFSAGRRHGDQRDVAPLWNALRGRAVLVVSAHDHNMQRLRPVDGITQVVSGAGGHGLYRLRRDRRLAFGDDRRFGALRLDLRPGRAMLRFVAADGRVLDRSALRCRQARRPSA